MPAQDDERSPLATPLLEEASESSPLLQDHDDLPSDIDEEEEDHTPQPPKPRSWAFWPRIIKRNRNTAQTRPASKSGWRWPSIVAMLVLASTVITIIVLAFIVPPAVQDYAEKAAVLEPTNLSIEDITSDGIRARIQATVHLDGSRVENKNSRRIGKFVTGIMRKLETKETTVNVYLPDYNDALAGSAVIPPLVIDITEGYNNKLDFVADINPGDAGNIRKIANDWLDGKLKQLRLVGKTQIDIKSGIVPLGTHEVAESLVFEANKIPSIPDYKINRLDLHDVPVDGHGRKAIEADVSLTVHNDYPLTIDVPSLGFEVLVPNCDSSLPLIGVAEAVTSLIHIRAKEDVKAEAKGVVREIPESLTRACPHSASSPLDQFMNRYLHGEDAKILVRGKKVNDTNTPEWISDIIESITVPLEFPGRSFDNFIRNFSLTDVDFKLPNPFADANDPNSSPRVSGTAEVLAAVPPELNVDLGVESIRTIADLFYEERKLGVLNLDHWTKANSTKIQNDTSDETLLSIISRVVDVPLNITDSDVFSEVIQKMLFGDEDFELAVKAKVDVKVVTVLGILTVKNVPAEGKIPVKRLPGNTLAKLRPQVGEVEVVNTSTTGMHIRALVNITNPTPYTAVIPYFNIHILNSGHILGEAVATNVNFGLGKNINIPINAVYDPLRFGGRKAQDIGRRLLSEYVSGENTTLTAMAHRGTVPNVPLIGEALSKINITMPTPRIRIPGEDKDSGRHFIKDATFHIFSSSATFTLLSPLQYNTVYIEYINATAFYNHTEPVGQIIYEEPLAVTPGRSETPRLPVKWSVGSVGYGKLKEALGGSLKLDAVADVTIRMGNWIEQIHYIGKGIGAKVTL